MIPWPDPTPKATCDDCLAELRSHATDWQNAPLVSKIEILDRVAISVAAAAIRWVEVSCLAKGIDAASDLAAEEWLAGPWTVLRHVALQARTLRDIQRHGSPKLPGRARKHAINGRTVAPVFPTDPLDKILFRGLSAEVWMERGVRLAQLEESMGTGYQEGASREPTVTLVLGAGNVSSIGPLDALCELFARGAAVLLKTSPVNAYLGTVWGEALAPLVDLGVLRIVHGDAALGDELAQHDAVDRIHITGSDRTHDAIVWGTGAVGEQNRAAGTKRNARLITAELGNVSPVIVVPGPWSKGDLAFQAANVATSLVNNAGFNCVASRVLITAKDWPLRREFLDAVGVSLAAAACRKPYYPGAQVRHDKILAASAGSPPAAARRFGVADAEHPQWTLIEDVDPTDTEHACFRSESWCGLMAETALSSGDPHGNSSVDPIEFLRSATEFCNDVLYGTLNATLLVHPKLMLDPKKARAVEDAITRLRYGTVAVNVWAGTSFTLGSTPWGAYPGHAPEDIQSGTGWTHNTYLFERIEKTVVRGPFRMWPRPAWFHDTKRAGETARRLFELSDKTTAWRLARLALSAARG